MEKLMSTSGGGIPNPIKDDAAIGFIEAKPKASVAIAAANQANIPKYTLLYLCECEKQIFALFRLF